MAPKKDTVTVRFPTFEEIIKMEEFDGVDAGGTPENIYIKVQSTDGHVYFSFTADALGKSVVLTKTRDGGYSDDKEFTINEDEVRLFHKVVKVLAGTPVDPPIDIDGDSLTYDKASKVFECGCKRIDLESADEVFRFIGGILGYTIT
jgi:hypothetical protein